MDKFLEDVIKKPNPCLMIIDMQTVMENFFQSPECVSSLVDNQIIIVNSFYKINAPITYLEFSPNSYGETVKPLKTKLEEIGALKFIKEEKDGFSNSHLRPYLQERNIENLVLMGGILSLCFYETAYSAKQRLKGIKLTTSHKLTYDTSLIEQYKSRNHKKRLNWLKRNTDFYD